jgi:hypothetical protein
MTTVRPLGGSGRFGGTQMSGEAAATAALNRERRKEAGSIIITV